MVTYIGKTTTIKGGSGRAYIFRLFTFESYQDLTTYWISQPALYLFTHRAYGNGTFYHNYLYVGEAHDLSSHLSNLIIRDDLINNEANCIGICKNISAEDESEREFALNDILEVRTFPFNIRLDI